LLGKKGKKKKACGSRPIKSMFKRATSRGGVKNRKGGHRAWLLLGVDVDTITGKKDLRGGKGGGKAVVGHWSLKATRLKRYIRKKFKPAREKKERRR